MSIANMNSMKMTVMKARFARKYYESLLHGDLKLRELNGFQQLSRAYQIIGKDSADKPILHEIDLDELKTGMSVVFYYQAISDYNSITNSHIYAHEIKDFEIQDDSLLIVTEHSMYSTPNLNMKSTIQQISNKSAIEFDLLHNIKDFNLMYEEQKILGLEIDIGKEELIAANIVDDIGIDFLSEMENNNFAIHDILHNNYQIDDEKVEIEENNEIERTD